MIKVIDNILPTKKDEEEMEKLIDQIHDEFNFASEEQLKKAEFLLEKLNVSGHEKGERLDKLGFMNIPQVVQYRKVADEITVNERTAHLIRKYSVRYPAHKFITDEMVQKICDKYGLVYGDVSLYTGFVPEKNLDAVERFPGIDENDSQLVVSSMSRESEVMSYFSYEDIKQVNPSGSIWRQLKNGGGWHVSTIFGKNGEDCPDDMPKIVPKTRFDSVRINKQLYIAAPEKDMKVKTGFNINKFKVQEVPDPVILQPISGGWLILTAWGAEASDPIVVDEKMN